MIVGITGAEGLFGWHMRALLRVEGGHEVRLATRATFATSEALEDFVRDLDGLVHLAGMNRGPEADVEKTNIDLAKSVVAALKQTRAKPDLVFSNSTHRDRDTGYGRGKKAAAQVLRAWAVESGAAFADLVFPHIFGENGKPFYNSVVSTFCQQLARNEEPRILVDQDVELLHAQAAARRCMAALAASENGTAGVAGTRMKVSALLERLRGLRDAYVGQLVPDLRAQIDVELFNTLRAYLYPDHYPVALTLHGDARGSLFEAIKSRNGGQTFLSTTHPGVTRGNHFHTRKIERFLVASGQAEIRLRRLFTDDVRVFRVDGENPCYVDMPTFHTHCITNTGTTELVTLFWSNEIFNPDDPDTFPEAVSP
jgi:UDP-2-acetamido-2,6-beta-L-arabino-hexul-4-ose reductase